LHRIGLAAKLWRPIVVDGCLALAGIANHRARLVWEMGFEISVTKTVTTTAPSGYVRFFHGTLKLHVGSFVQGIDFAKCNNEFWVSTEPQVAWDYASVAEQQLLFTSGFPGQALLAFNLPMEVLDSFRGMEPDPWLLQYMHGLRFVPACASELNRTATAVEITFEQ
jgi:hypothetical protein